MSRLAELNQALYAGKYSSEEHIALIEDVNDIQREEECSLETAAYILLVRIGGTGNLRSYVDSLMAGK